jgi:hypothetical protein
MKLKLLISLIAAAIITFSGFEVYGGNDNNVATELNGNTLKLGQNYPNPAQGKTYIDVSFAAPEATLKIYNVLGKLVEEVSVVDKRIILDVSNYPEGVYLYTLEADGEKVTRRMTVKK